MEDRHTHFAVQYKTNRQSRKKYFSAKTKTLPGYKVWETQIDASP